jgi:hypothetical protein
MAMSLCPVSSCNATRSQPAPSAPRANGARILEPPAERVGQLLADNRAIIDRADYDVQGIRLADLAAEARAQLIAAGLAYTRQYRDVPDPVALPAGILLAGHQPEIFHPGVWLKNFVLHRLAQRHDAVAVNLVIDSDTIKTSSLRVPGGTPAKPRAAAVLFDTPSAEIPFQARAIQDLELFGSFGRRAAERMAPLVSNPMVREFWPLAVDCARRTGNLGQSLSQARHRWEGHWGLTTLEIPQSLVCCLPAFHQLTAHLMANLPRLWEVYNSAIAEYRRQHHIRSHSHPAPELASEGAWLEAPYWIWTADNPRRRRVFILPRGEDMVISDLQGLEIPLRLSPESAADVAAGQLAALADRGIHLGSRALLTTLAARVLLGDLFIHGIGGAKYDRLTDAMIQRFFCLPPPAFLVVSGTLHLPILHESVTHDDLRAVRNRLRELEFHPEVFLDSQSESPRQNGSGIVHWVHEKRQWIGATVAPQESRRRCRAIREANQQLQPYVADRQAELVARGDLLGAQLRAEAVLSSREYGFCLYPADTLRSFLLDFPRAQ